MELAIFIHPISPSGVSGNFIEVNDAACKMLGFTKKVLLKMSPGDIAAVEAPDVTRSRTDRLLKDNKVVYETVYLAKDARRIRVEVSSQLVNLAGEAMVLSVAQDVTERKQAAQELHKSEEKYRNLVDHANEAIIIAQDGMLKFVNPKTIELIGYSSKELTSKPFLDFVHPEDRKMVAERYAARLRGEEVPDTYSFRIVDKSGDTRWGEIKAVWINWEGKRATLNFITDITERKKATEELNKHRERLEELVKERTAELEKSNVQLRKEITERKRAEKALRASEERFRELAELLPQTVFEIDTEGNITYGNRAGYEAWRYKPEDVEEGVTALQMFVPEDRDRIAWDLKKSMSGFDFRGDGYTALRKDGTTFPVLMYTNPIIESGKTVGLRGIAVDISDYKKARETLAKSQAQFRALSEGVKDVFLSIDTEGTIQYLNPAVYDVVGYAPSELVGKNVFDLPLIDVRIRRFLAKALKLGRLGRLFEISVKDVNGRRHILEILTRRISNQIFGVARDVTERKRMVQQLLRTSKLASMGVFASGIAHQVNNPLAIMMASTTALRDLLSRDIKDTGKLHKKAGKYLDALKQQMDRTRKVVDGLLAFAKEKESNVAPLDIAGVIKEAVQLFSHHFSAGTLSVELKLSNQVPPALVDPVALQQVMVNVIGNAVDAMQGKGQLQVGAELTSEGYIGISVSDTGPGIGEEIKDEIFEPLFSTKPSEKGTGLGLPISVLLLERFGGRIYLEERSGPGATFIIEVPTAKEKTDES
jgi:PAS domain S-box-containing protein